MLNGKLAVRSGESSEPPSGYSALLNQEVTCLEEEDDMESSKIEKGASKTILMLSVMLILVGGIYYAYTQSASLRGGFHSVKESTQDATTTSRVRTALLLSKRVSPFDIKVETIQSDVTLTGQVPSDEVKTVAGAIAQDTAGVKQVHNNLGINPTAERNPETERLGERVADLEVKPVVGDALSKSPELKDKHIDVQVKSRIVTLGGALETAGQKYNAEQIAWQASGVQGVINNIIVTNGLAAPETADEKLE